MMSVTRLSGQVHFPHRAPWFDLEDRESYLRWRDTKLARYPAHPDDIAVEVRDPLNVTAAERAAIADRCARANMAIYVFENSISDGRDERIARRRLLAFGAAFGLHAIEDHRSAEADGIVRIEEACCGGRSGYIPYTNRAIAWHTDGYYNFHGPDRCVDAMLLHCIRNAALGGENRLLDPEIAYIRLRDQDPSHVEALTHQAAMSIPENVEDDGHVRPVNVGPVFFFHPAGALGMRYTARKRSIVWRDDEKTRRATLALERILESDPLIFSVRMKPEQGLICNNVLHDRSGFRSSPGEERLLFRVRYHGRIRGTDD